MDNSLMTLATEHSTQNAQSNGHATWPLADLVLERVRLCAKRRIAWLQHVWAANETNGQSIHADIDTFLGNLDTPEAETAWQTDNETLQNLHRAIRLVERNLAQDPQMNRLRHIFGLSDIESDYLQACFAQSVEPNIGRLYAYLQDHTGRPFVTETLVARLFGHGRTATIETASPLKTWQLITEIIGSKGEPNRYEIDAFIRSYLLNINDLDAKLIDVAQATTYTQALECWPVKQTLTAIQAISEQDDTKRMRIFVSGPNASGKKTFATCVATQIGLPSIAIDAAKIADADWPKTYTIAQRLAYLQNCVLIWHNIGEKTWPTHLPPYHIQFVCTELTTPTTPIKGVTDHHVTLPDMNWQERADRWQMHLSSAQNWDNLALKSFAKKHNTTIGQIIHVAENQSLSIEQADEALRQNTRQNLDGLAQLLTCNLAPDDLIVPDWLRRHLDDFAYEAAQRNEWWERPEAKRLFPQGRGLLALFNGASGTGKTMAAQVMAAQLQRDLFRIDLSTVVSKYVGETSKNLERILQRAERMNAILFFDEADALFGKRTEVKDAHDRFANTDTNYLLQAIEQYPGIAILASNKKGNIDDAFLRRLRYVLDFPRPDTAQRLQMWQRIVGELTNKAQAKAMQTELNALAEAAELTGAQIKLAVLSAVFMAKREGKSLNINYLIRGIERELMKENRGLSQQLTRLAG